MNAIRRAKHFSRSILAIILASLIVVAPVESANSVLSDAELLQLDNLLEPKDQPHLRTMSLAPLNTTAGSETPQNAPKTINLKDNRKVFFSCAIKPSADGTPGLTFEFHNDSDKNFVYAMIITITKNEDPDKPGASKSPVKLQLLLKFECGPLQSYHGHQYFYKAAALSQSQTYITVDQVLGY